MSNTRSPRSTKRLERIKLYLEKCGCALCDINPPVTDATNVPIQCACGTHFSKTGIQLRRDIGRSYIENCGCTNKTWTNATIDDITRHRHITRVTNCNVKGISPSVHKIHWKCDECDYQWNARIDSIVNKQSGCPNCAGNLAYTVATLNAKLESQSRNDLHALAIIPGSITLYKMGEFQCNTCLNCWAANIHNVIKFRYGCPKCNDNTRTRVIADDQKFDSKLEYYFWKVYMDAGLPFELIRQSKYLPDRKFTCDYRIPELLMWIEISGSMMLKHAKYVATIQFKKSIIKARNNTFVVLSSFAEINQFIRKLSNGTP